MKPLRGKNIIVTRAQPQVSGFAKILRSLGARVLACPTIRIQDPPSFTALDKAVRGLDGFDWVIFTSVNGVEKFAERRKKAKARLWPASVKTCAIGPATAERMKARGIPVSRVSKEYVAESILDEIKKPKGKKILIPRAAQAREVLPQELRKRGSHVVVAQAYRTVLDRSKSQLLRPWIAEDKADCVTFTSSSTVDNFFRLLKPSLKRRLFQNQVSAASIGPITTQTLLSHGWAPRIVARKPTTKHLAQAIVDYYRKDSL